MPTLFNILLEATVQTRKRNKKNPNWKGRLKLSWFEDDNILYIENPKDATKNY